MITEDPSIFLADFGVPVVAGAVSGTGILDLNSEIILGGEAVMIDYLLTVPTATFGGLSYGDGITVNGTNYKVESQPLRFDDGTFCRVPLVPGAGDSPADPSLQGKEIRWDAQATVIYRGIAPANSSESSPVWRIKRSLFTPAGVLIGSSSVTAATWTGRAGHIYP